MTKQHRLKGITPEKGPTILRSDALELHKELIGYGQRM